MLIKKLNGTRMDKKRITLFLGTILIIFTKGTETSPSRYQDNYLEDEKFAPPGFLTLGQKYSIAIGSTVVLPCKINETDKQGLYVLAWKRNIAVLTAGHVKVTVNPRIRLMPVFDDLNVQSGGSTGYNLEIRDVRVTDAGDYACQIGTMVPKEIVHTLEVLVPPKIDYISPSSKFDVSKGASIKLECRGSGNPTPKIVWSRKNNVMPNGEANITGNVLEMMHANRHTAGHYKCTADNRVGQSDSRDIFVNVLYAPEVEVERSFIHTGVGYEAQLICIVHAEPVPNIIWYKDTTQLGTTEQHATQNRGNRYSLVIRNVTYIDLGNYTCQASNSLGKDRGSLTLSAIPTICYFESPALSNNRDQYNITWTVQSYSPIREYRLFYRKQAAKIHSHYDKSVDNHIASPFYTPYSTTLVDQWENVVIPELYSSYHHNAAAHHSGVHNYRHRMSFLIKNLSPSSNYEARVQARNDYGWNKLSNVFHFSTRSEDLEMEPSAQPAVLHGAGLLDKGVLSSSSNSQSRHISILLTLFLIIYSTT